MSIPVVCKCGKRLRAKDEFAGKRTVCPECGQPLTVPGLPTVEQTTARTTQGKATAAKPESPDIPSQEAYSWKTDWKKVFVGLGALLLGPALVAFAVWWWIASGPSAITLATTAMAFAVVVALAIPCCKFGWETLNEGLPRTPLFPRFFAIFTPRFLGKTGVILGVVGLWLGPLTTILGFLVSVYALNDIQVSKWKLPGKWWAISGSVLNVCTTVVWFRYVLPSVPVSHL